MEGMSSASNSGAEEDIYARGRSTREGIQADIAARAAARARAAEYLAALSQRLHPEVELPDED